MGIKHNGESQALIDNSSGMVIINTLQEVSSSHVIIACTPEGAVFRSTLQGQSQTLLHAYDWDRRLQYGIKRLCENYGL